MIIEYINPIWCKVSKDEIPILQQVLYYKDSFWRQGPFHKIRKEFNRPLVSKGGLFLTGFLPRVENYFNKRNIPFELANFPTIPDQTTNPTHWSLRTSPNSEFQLRPEQEEARFQALQYQRGVIHYPTGSGKTIIYMSIIDAFPNSNVIILLHRQDLLYQTYEIAKKLYPDGVGIIGDSKKEPNRITIAMIQTMNKLEKTEFHEKQDIVIVDEAHHVSSFTGMYYKVLTQIPASIRLGFTATLPYTDQSQMALEGLIGLVIAEKKIQEIDSLAKIIIKLRKIPYSQSVHDLRTWKDVYKMGVVWNSRKHRMVLEDTQELIQQGRTVLILVVEIQHGRNLLEMAKQRFPNLPIDFVYGSTPSEERFKIKDLLNRRSSLKAVIANVVWREGVDIPSLGAVINAAGGKSEIMTIQSIGRGSRTTEEKKDVIIRDYFDPSHHYLISHFGERLTLYFEEGWL